MAIELCRVSIINLSKSDKSLTKVCCNETKKGPDWALRSKVVGSIPNHGSNFLTPDCKNQIKVAPESV